MIYSPDPPFHRAIRLAGAWEALFVYDSILFTLTMVKTWKNRSEFTLNPSQSGTVSIIYLIFRDGAIYFAVMALANLANILTFYFCGPFMRGGLSTFASGISVTMMSRLMLNLHENADTGIYSTTRTNLTSTGMECHSPSTDVELDTIWSGNGTYQSAAPFQSFGLGGDSITTTRPAPLPSQLPLASRPRVEMVS
ncbi:hypothetical protein DXG01_013925 [Tephrocybe rancida]|nr:hypothetical protein DXG01_013925 [Tephrocybe rancida]